MRILGVDYGAARTGLALGDTETGMAFPLRVLPTADLLELARELVAIAKSEGCEAFVVGLPTRLNVVGGAGITECEVMDLLLKMSDLTDLPIETEDERFTTAYAERMKKESGGASKIGADAIAAAAILETYMERAKRAIGNR